MAIFPNQILPDYFAYNNNYDKQPYEWEPICEERPPIELLFTIVW